MLCIALVLRQTCFDMHAFPLLPSPFLSLHARCKYRRSHLGGASVDVVFSLKFPRCFTANVLPMLANVTHFAFLEFDNAGQGISFVKFRIFGVSAYVVRARNTPLKLHQLTHFANFFFENNKNCSRVVRGG